MLTAERLREVMTYDPLTGVFVYLGSKRSRRRGRVAGSLDKNTGYLHITIDYKKYWLHRVAWLYMTGAWPASLIDHKDTNGQNNRWDNLREADKSQNGANRGAQVSNKVGLKGVSFCKATSRYRADIDVKGRHRNLGRFDCPAAAHFQYILAADEAFGEYARAA